MVVGLFWVVVGGGRFILGGGGRWQVFYGWLWMVLSLYRVVVGRGGFIWMVQRFAGRLKTSLLFYKFQNLLMAFIIQKMNHTQDRGKIFW